MNLELREFHSFADCYTANQTKIASKVTKGRFQHLYHFEVKGDLALVAKHLEAIFRDNLQAYKVNLAFGYILKTVARENYKFYHPSNNNSLLPQAKLIQNRQDQDNLLNLCTPDNILEFVYNSRMASSWVVSSVVCFSVRITPLNPEPRMTLRSKNKIIN